MTPASPNDCQGGVRSLMLILILTRLQSISTCPHLVVVVTVKHTETHSSPFITNVNDAKLTLTSALLPTFVAAVDVTVEVVMVGVFSPITAHHVFLRTLNYIDAASPLHHNQETLSFVPSTVVEVSLWKIASSPRG